ncbi:MAG: hypothetical protein KIT48_13960 [Pseudolabrys sp.]|nr:hypothetical protein [Pseudolabrys sp.]
MRNGATEKFIDKRLKPLVGVSALQLALVSVIQLAKSFLGKIEGSPRREIACVG